MKIRGLRDGLDHIDGHDHRCIDCPPSVLHLPSEICGSCGRCDDHAAPGCQAHNKTRELTRKRGGE